MQAKFLNFLRDSPWRDQSVRLESARYVIEALRKRETVATWIVDDTGFPKQGRHAVGVLGRHVSATHQPAEDAVERHSLEPLMRRARCQ